MTDTILDESVRKGFDMFIRDLRYIHVTDPYAIDVNYYPKLSEEINKDDPEFFQYFLFSNEQDAYLFSQIVPENQNLYYSDKANLYIVGVDYFGIKWNEHDRVLYRYNDCFSKLYKSLA